MLAVATVLFAPVLAAGRGLRAGVGRIATFQGELRAVHLRAHLETRSGLTAQQIQHYNQLRGYAGSSVPAHEPKERH